MPPNEPLKLRDERRALTLEFGKLKSYIHKYRKVKLQITNMDDSDRLHGLRP